MRYAIYKTNIKNEKIRKEVEEYKEKISKMTMSELWNEWQNLTKVFSKEELNG